MSEDQNKKDSAQDLKAKLGGPGSKLPGALPGLGGPSKAPLPGLGKPSKAPLPGLGGPSKAPLPGVGAKPSVGPLPGAKPSQGAPVPPFMQQQQQQQAPQPQQPSPEQVARDPFGTPPAPSTTAVRPSTAPGQGLIGASSDASVSFTEAQAGASKKIYIIGGVIIGVVALLIGYFAGKGYSGRVALNIAIRDALIIDYEINEAAKLFNEVQTVVSTAVLKASKREYDKNHVSFLSQKVKGNPIPGAIFTERNYKNFDAAAVQWLMDYYQNWDRLDKLIQAHRMKTKNDEAALTASADAFAKLIETQYGVVFTRANNNFVGNVVMIGSGEKEGTVKVQAAPGTYGDDRTLYNPEPGDGELTKEPDKYVVVLDDASKRGLLQNASQSQFKEYASRLAEMNELMKAMAELQANLKQKLSGICSQDPVPLGGIDAIEEAEDYKKKHAGGAAPAAE